MSLALSKRSLVATAVRAWLVSVAVAIVVLAVAVTAWQLLMSQTKSLVHNAVDLSLGFGMVFALTAALVHIPIFTLLELRRRQRLSRGIAVILGIALAPLVSLAIAWSFRESGDPQSLVGWIGYAAANLPWLVLGSWPFAAAGAMFGVTWSALRESPQ